MIPSDPNETDEVTFGPPDMELPIVPRIPERHRCHSAVCQVPAVDIRQFRSRGTNRPLSWALLVTRALEPVVELFARVRSALHGA